MQMPISEIRNLSLWQYTAVVQGWNEANKTEGENEPLSEEEELALFKALEEPPIWLN